MSVNPFLSAGQWLVMGWLVVSVVLSAATVLVHRVGRRPLPTWLGVLIVVNTIAAALATSAVSKTLPVYSPRKGYVWPDGGVADWPK